MTMQWPRKGMKAFSDKKGGKLVQLAALIHRFDEHSEGFKLAADMIVEGYDETISCSPSPISIVMR